MQARIIEIIQEEMARFEGEPLAEQLRWAAALAKEELPQTTSGDFADAAVLCGLHRQGARNRWNEMLKNMEGIL